MPVATIEPPTLKIALGADKAGVFDAGLTVLGGKGVEALFPSARPAGQLKSFALFQDEGWLLGAATVPLSSGLEQETRRLYEAIFQASRGKHLARIWNYVPDINDAGPGGLENYRIFCQGRSLAFEQHYGSGYKAALPAASAVGSKSPALTIVFAACPLAPRHVENPAQIPAYDYPPDYGPRAPSFARATVVPGRESAAIFISGTAAIRGHETVAPHSLSQQLECALGNLQEISRACGLGPALDQGGPAARHFKVYLRRAADQPQVAAVLTQKLVGAADKVSYLRADICRRELLVEIEASLFGVSSFRA